MKRYKKGDLTVVWQPHLCIHSMVCWKGLKDVFDPRKRPWVNIDGADEAAIREQVARCPSGALSYVQDNEAAPAHEQMPQADVAVHVMKNGPLVVYGDIKVKDAAGNEVIKAGKTALCRCGASGTKPFCDGSHMRIGFRDDKGEQG